MSTSIDKQRVRRFAGFSMVGASGMVVDLSVTWSVLSLSHYLLANMLGFLVAVTWNFAGNWWFVFRRPEGSIPRQYASYVGLHVVTFGGRAVVLAGLIEVVGSPVMVATVIGIGCAAIANYLGTEKIFQDGLEWFDAVAALNSVAHAVYNSRCRQLLRSTGLYAPLYGAYSKLLAVIYRDDYLDIEAGAASAIVHTEHAPEVVSVLHTLEKERPVIEAFVGELESDMTVWDIGANLGVYSVLAADVADEIIGVEPIPSTADRLEDNLRANGADGRAVSIALGDDIGETTLGIERDELGTQTPAMDSSEIDMRDTITTTIVTGDALVETDILPAPDAIKVDVEGAEDRVLAGLEDTMERVSVAVVETHGVMSARVEKQLKAAGMAIEKIDNSGQRYYIGKK